MNRLISVVLAMLLCLPLTVSAHVDKSSNLLCLAKTWYEVKEQTKKFSIDFDEVDVRTGPHFISRYFDIANRIRIFNGQEVAVLLPQYSTIYDATVVIFYEHRASDGFIYLAATFVNQNDCANPKWPLTKPMHYPLHQKIMEQIDSYGNI